MNLAQIIQNNPNIETPAYCYDTELLNRTLVKINYWSQKYDYQIHYAIKANANNKILELIRNYDLGIDCVSGNEIKLAIETGFQPSKIIFAGVGKVVDEISYAKKVKTNIAIRINPDIDAKTGYPRKVGQLSDTLKSV